MARLYNFPEKNTPSVVRDDNLPRQPRPISDNYYFQGRGQNREAAVVYQMISEIEQEANSLKGPSKFKYAMVGAMALFVDVAVPLLSLDPTGLGAFLGEMITISLGNFTIPFILWITDGNHKRNVKFLEKIGSAAAGVENRMQNSASRGKIASVRTEGISRAVKNNPVLKTLFGGIIDAIPLVGILNLLVVWVYLTYRDERKAYKETQSEAETVVNNLVSQFGQQGVIYRQAA